MSFSFFFYLFLQRSKIIHSVVLHLCLCFSFLYFLLESAILFVVKGNTNYMKSTHSHSQEVVYCVITMSILFWKKKLSYYLKSRLNFYWWISKILKYLTELPTYWIIRITFLGYLKVLLRMYFLLLYYFIYKFRLFSIRAKTPVRIWHSLVWMKGMVYSF
jgi:hypothetical protein